VSPLESKKAAINKKKKTGKNKKVGKGHEKKKIEIASLSLDLFKREKNNLFLVYGPS
jgi:hypothetical protein